MQIVCPQCAASYLVATVAMGDGRMVRCTNCGHVWLAICKERATPAHAAVQSAVQADAAAAAGDGQAAFACSDPDAAQDVAEPAAAQGESTDFFAPGSESGTAAAAEAPSLVPDADIAVPADGDLRPRDDGLGERAQAEEPAMAASSGTTIDAEPGDDNAFVQQRAARRKRAAQRRKDRGSNWPTAVLSLLVIIAAILAFRAQVVRAMPQTAALFAGIGLPVNLRGLAFDEVSVEKEQADGVAALVVHGKIVNVTRRLLEVPRLRFALCDAKGGEVYHWTALPEQQALGPGDTVTFRTRLASPPESGEDVVIRFFSRSDR